MNVEKCKEPRCFRQNSETVKSPEQEYGRRLKQRHEELITLQKLHSNLWKFFGLAVFGLIIALGFAFSERSVGAYIWCAVPVVMGVSAIRSLKVNADRHDRVRRLADFYEVGLARCSGRGWQGRGHSGDEFRPDKHVYAADLDLFGKGSLFELLCTAQSPVGRSTLAGWLLMPADCGEVHARQEAIAELRTRLELQEEFVSLGDRSYANLDAEALREWSKAPGSRISKWERIASIVLPILVLLLASIGLWSSSGLLRWAVLLPIIGEATVAALLHERVRNMIEGVRWFSYDLSLLSAMMDRFGRDKFNAPLLQHLQSRLKHSAKSPTRNIRVLSFLTWLLSLRDISEWLALAVSPLLYATNLAIAVEFWRQTHRRALPIWLDSVGQFEALLSLARYSYENPDHTFPVVRSSGTATLRAERLGHPLIPAGSCVRCDLELESHGTQLVMISGSNMGGKSTLLRSVGVNSVLAFAGSMVRAEHMELSPLHIACSIGVQDSLLEGKSRFQAEVERLKWIFTISVAGPTLFLLDEVLGGTNSTDRYFGTEVMIERLLGSGSVGLVTTHDLAVTEVATAQGGRAANMHFEEQYEDGDMRFDYQLRSGVLTRTNGRNILAALGLLSAERT